MIGTFCTVLIYKPSLAQNNLDSLLHQWLNQKSKADYRPDTTDVLLLEQIISEYVYDQPDSALVYCDIALQLAQDLEFRKSEMNILYLIGKAYYIKGAFDLSLKYDQKALELSKVLDDEAGYALGLNTIGLIYLGQDNYEAAIKQFFEAVKINEARQDSLLLTKNFFNISICYDETARHDTAIYYAEKVIEIGNKIQDYRMVVMAKNRLGEAYFHLNDYQEALSYYNEVLNDTIYRNNWENAFAYSGLGQTYFQLGQYQKSVENALKSYEVAHKMNAKWDMERALRILSDAYAALHKYDQAYHYHTLFKAYSDSLNSEAKEREINFLHLQQKEVENEQLAQENQLQRHKNRLNQLIILIFCLITVLFIVVALLIYRSNRQKNRLNGLLVERNENIAAQKEKILEQNEELSALNDTKDQLFSVISHDLKSPFASIMGTFELINQGLLDTKEQQYILKELHRKVSNVSEMLNNLLYWANSQQKGINAVLLKVSLPVIVDNILSVSNMLAEEKQISIKHTADCSKFIYADPDHVKIILQNIIGNAIKFTPANQHIQIFYSEDEVYLAVHVKDSGVGIPENKLDKIFVEGGQSISSRGTNREKGTGIGLMLVKQFVEANDGKLHVKSEMGEGSEFTVYFKKYIGQEVMGELEIYSEK